MSELALQLIKQNKQTRNPVLDLGNCGLTHLPDEIGDCTWLETLILSNRWQEYDEEQKKWVEKISQNKGEKNRLRALPARLALLKGLKKLFIGDEFNPWSLSDLFLFRKLTHLQTFTCSNNLVSDLSPLRQLTQLQMLYCSITSVSDLSPLRQLTQLQKLDCSDTRVSDLSPLSQLTQLQELYCSDTQVKKIRPLKEMKALRVFRVDGCPIEDCPADIYQQRNIELLRQYFDALPDEKPLPKDVDTRRDVKLILLGNSDAGKTTLLHYLQTGDYLDQRDSTHGLKVHRWLPNSERFPLLQDVAVSVWDFGGQEYYHETYRLFMSDNAVYLLLWDAATNLNGRQDTCLRTGEAKVPLEHFELRYWLDTVQHYAGERNNAPLLVVQNKTDLGAGKRRLDQPLHDDYRIRESLHISLCQGCDPQHPRQQQALRLFERELEAAIAEAADSASLPPIWLTVRQRILDLQEGNSENDNPFQEYLKEDGSVWLGEFEQAAAKIMGRATGLEPQDLPRTFHRGGVVAFFEQSEALRNRVFLKPAELTRRIHDILNQQVLAKGGEFHPDELGSVGDFKQVFLDVAKQLELIFPHPLRKGWYVAPQYLPDEHPIEDLLRIAAQGVWQSAFWLRVPLFHYKKLMHRLILHYAQEERSEARHFWKHGIVFLKNGLRVLLKGLYPAENEHDGVLLIGVEGAAEGKREALELQKEIFAQCKHFLQGKIEAAQPQSTKGSEMSKSSEAAPTEDEAPASIPILRLDEKAAPRMDVSYDGAYFVKYAALRQAAERGHIRIPGKDKAGQEQTLLIRRFEVLLPRPPRRAKRVFLSYSHRNTEWLHRLRVHLSGLRRSDDVELWTDQEILPGEQWDEVIQQKLKEADVFILLLSADAIASDYIWDKELKPAIKGFLEKKKQFIPLLIEPMDLGALPGVAASSQGEEMKVQDFEIVPKDADGRLKAVSLWDNPEEALSTVAKRIRDALKK